MARRSSDGAIIVLIIGAIFGLLWGIIKFIFSIFETTKTKKIGAEKMNKEREDKFAGREVNTSLNLFDRNEDIIEKYKERIVTSSSSRSYRYYYIDNMTRDCINDICIAEGDYNIKPGQSYLSSWKSNAPEEWKDLATKIETIFKDREKELEKIEKEDTERRQGERFAELVKKYQDLITQFNEIVYRKVTTIDDYGEENWDALDKEANLLIEKIAKREGIDEDGIKRWRKYSWNIPEEYINLTNYLTSEFKGYYKNRKNKSIHNEDIKDMSGIEFENHLAELLKSNGFENVSGTPKTGDQGADLIAKRNGRTIIIQAKRYEGTVGNKAVQEVVSAVNFYNGDEGWVITNSTFTKSARELARKSDVRLVDGSDLQLFSDYIKNI